jgi:hypothetical protein
VQGRSHKSTIILDMSMRPGQFVRLKQWALVVDIHPDDSAMSSAMRSDQAAIKAGRVNRKPERVVKKPRGRPSAASRIAAELAAEAEAVATAAAEANAGPRRKACPTPSVAAAFKKRGHTVSDHGLSLFRLTDSQINKAVGKVCFEAFGVVKGPIDFRKTGELIHISSSPSPSHPS